MIPDLGNLARPFILGRLSLGAVAVIACAMGLAAAFSWFAAERSPLGSAIRIRAERRAELASALVQVALFATILGALISIVGADRAHGELPGAMCAYGVFAAAPHGFASLATNLLASAACSAWIALHRLDLRLPTPELTRAKLLALCAVVPAVVYDFVTALRFALELDFSVVATCCSSGLDEVATSVAGSTGGRGLAFPAAAVVGFASVALSRRLALRSSRPLAVATILSLLVLSVLGTLAAIDVVAPHVFGVPSHRCAFCLFSAEGYHLGYLMMGALFMCVCVASALLAVELERVRAPDEVARFERSLALEALVVSATATVSLLAPVVAYRIATGAFVVQPW